MTLAIIEKKIKQRKEYGRQGRIRSLFAVRIPKLILQDRRLSSKQKLVLSTLLAISDHQRIVSNRQEVRDRLIELLEIDSTYYDSSIVKFRKLEYLEQTPTRYKLKLGKFQCVTDFVQVELSLLRFLKDRIPSYSYSIDCAFLYSYFERLTLRAKGDFKVSQKAVCAYFNITASQFISYMTELSKSGALKYTGIDKWNKKADIERKFSYVLRVPKLQPKIVEFVPKKTKKLVYKECKQDVPSPECKKFFLNKGLSSKYFTLSRKTNAEKYVYTYINNRELYKKGGLSLTQASISREMWKDVRLNYFEYQKLAKKYGHEKLAEMFVTYSNWKKEKGNRQVDDCYELDRGWVLDLLKRNDLKIRMKRLGLDPPMFQGALLKKLGDSLVKNARAEQQFNNFFNAETKSWKDQLASWREQKKLRAEKRKMEKLLNQQLDGTLSANARTEHQIALQKEKDDYEWDKYEKLKRMEFRDKDPFENYSGYR